MPQPKRSVSKASAARSASSASTSRVTAKKVHEDITRLEDSLRALRDREVQSGNVNHASIAGIDNLLSTLHINVAIVAWE